MLKQSNCIKRALTTVAFSLQADAGESFLIKTIYAGHTALATGYPVLRVDRKTVGCYRGGAIGINHLGSADDTYHAQNLMKWLAEHGVNVSIPVAEGQTFTIERSGNTGDVTVVYDIYGAGDITAAMPNGSDAKEFMFIQYMTTSAALAAVGDHLLDVSLSPAEFPDFPCGRAVPPRHTIELLGLVGAPVSNGDAASGHTTSQYLKLIKDRETLFDEDRNGIPFIAGENLTSTAMYKTEHSLVGDCGQVGADLSDPALGVPLLFDPPLIFESGEELQVYLTCSYAASGSIAVGEVRVGAILRGVIS